MDIILALTNEFNLKKWQIENVVSLIDDGNTIPFIARYRKEAHGTLDDQTLRAISERLEYLRNLDKRREEIRSSIDGQEKLTDEISAALDKAVTLAELEDIYRPFKPKRKTRASVAREKGLEPLAQAIYLQAANSPSALELAKNYINEEKEVNSAEDALQGAMDIIAEDISDMADIRRRLKNLLNVVGTVNVKASDPDAKSVYEQYYDYSEPVSKIADHRILAINRGENEGFLKVSLDLDRVKALNVIASETLTDSGSLCTDTVRDAGVDAYDRLIFPSVEREIRSALTERADASAIKNFSLNLKELLLQPPVKGKVALGLDPGYRTGCKVAVVDATGRVLDTGVAYITHSAAQQAQAKTLIKNLIKKYGVQIIAIGNGTASKETEIFTAELLKELNTDTAYMVVSEAGASVYSASKLAAEEFPQYDVSLRSAVSIARRLQDPLAELVKIDPKAIGVGQYQHDMPEKELDAALGGVVEACVNAVGVDLNTASAPLLRQVAGLNATTAKNIVAYREENGAFTSRAQIKKVPKLGPKAFEQCAGFLKIPESSNPLDNTWVHPENYDVAREVLPVIKEGGKLSGEQKKALCEKYNIGDTTLNDIIEELQKPNRDPRDGYPAPIMQKGVVQFEDLKEGMKVTGKIKNVVDFGAFVDIGLHETGLIHVSELSDSFVSDPMEVVKVGDIFEFTIIGLDKDRRRISLSLKSDAASRIGQGGSSKVSSESAEGAKRKVVVVKKGAASNSAGFDKNARKNSSSYSNREDGRNRNNRYSSGSDDGMSYNPFAALLKK
ncbi:MAG TPA: RNA-binding transcriptional accessory protein [Ruminococcaceae bacterium]|nr:RNA-binding transcriptional accessory protein [Oscillospiraceae bacterium]